MVRRSPSTSAMTAPNRGCPGWARQGDKENMPCIKPATRLVLALTCSAAMAHPGGVNSEGCHNNRKTGEYHCHGHTTPSKTTQVTHTAPPREPQGPSEVKPPPPTLPSGCHVGPRGGTYTITKSGKKNYGGC
ncbi:YHYH domain-containing protein [Hydrogenophaga soli]